MNKKMGIEALSWYGTLAIMGAYFGNSFGYLETQSIAYQALNASGALGIVLVSYMKSAYQSMILNIMWLLIGVIALSSLIF